VIKNTGTYVWPIHPKTDCLGSCFIVGVERLIECLRAARMPARQCFILDLEKRMKLAQIFHHMQKVLICILTTFCVECSRLNYFTIIRNDEHKMMGQDGSLGHLCNVQN
jgi:hypothetical protein